MHSSAIVAGGGIGGLTAALSLSQAGISVRVLEQAPQFSEAGAGIQISPNSSRVLHSLGLEAALRARGFLPEATEIRGWRNGQLISRSPLGADVVSRYGFPYYHVHRADLLNVLLTAAQADPRIELETSQQVQGFESGDRCVQVRTGTATHEASLLVGADGIHSQVRNALFGAEAATFTGNVAWRALVPTASLPEGLIKPVTGVWWGPGKHFVHYFVSGGKWVNCVCVVEKDGWDLESWTERGDRAELKEAFAGWHDDVQTLIDHMDPNHCYRWALYDRPPLKHWSRDRVTLLGDACHPTLPFMAQGAAMAIEDAAVLAQCVSQPIPVPTALERYESLRKERTAQVQRGSRRNARVFHLRGWKAWLRNRAARRAGTGIMDRLYRYNAFAQVDATAS